MTSCLQGTALSVRPRLMHAQMKITAFPTERSYLTLRSANGTTASKHWRGTR